MIVIYEVARPIYVYIGAHSILSRILMAMVVLQYIFVECFMGAATVPEGEI
jgi:hypothetical protein